MRYYTDVSIGIRPDDADLPARWDQLEKIQDNFFGILMRATFRCAAREALHEWSAGYCLLAYLERHPEIESLVRHRPSAVLL